jgi:hypothetical protein
MSTSALRGSRVLRAGIVVLVVALALVVVQVVRVHQATGEFRLTASQAPPKLHLHGRDYLRSSSAPASRLPRDTQEIGETPGGGELFGPRHVTLSSGTFKPSIVVPVVYVRDDDGSVWTYELQGSP